MKWWLSIALCLLAMPGHTAERLQHVSPDNARYQHSEVLMTTDVTFTIITTDDVRAKQAVQQAIAEIRRIEALLSEWQPDSEISRLNRSAATSPQTVSNETYRLLDEARKISEASDGAFDITFKSAGKLWDFRAQTIPSDEALAKAVAAIDYRQVAMKSKDRSIQFLKEGTQIGLGGIAKGYAVDRAVQIIRQSGFEEFAVNAGGDLYAVSQGNQKLWRVGVRNPRDDSALLALLPVANAAVATSGDYERFFIRDGRRYHHIINPHTGMPAEGSMSVTVLAPRTYLADALATAVFVLGPEAGMQMIEEQSGCEAMVVTEDGRILLSTGLNDLQGVPVKGQ
ncbi:FAD:protein FMN transferase [Thalassolituus sp.]|uniref:FAD:protein FMN transferase n=1 Tax=Thalassolituus sp. TaxID=2030822 RepID=UPI0035192ADF